MLVVPSGAVRAARAVMVVGAGRTGVGKGKNWEGAVQNYTHRRTQVAIVGNTTMAQ